MARLSVTVAELAELEPCDLGYGDWFALSQERVNTFADATDDHQWVHVDRARAQAGPFGTTIAHGYLTLSLLPRLLGELLHITDQARGTNYGLERVRFTSPVTVGSEIRLAGALVSAHRRNDAGVQFTIRAEVEVKGQVRPAMVAESVYLTYASTA